jgi:hypothetical protein
MVKQVIVNLHSGERVNKIAVAQRQLDTAIELLFRNGDYVSIHTLTCAAAQVLEDVCRARGVPSKVNDLFSNYISKGAISRAARNAIGMHRNFFKHADNDPEAVVKLPDHMLVQVLLYQAVVDYSNLGHEYSHAMRSYFIWFILFNPTALNETDPDIQMAYEMMKSFTDEERLRFGLYYLLLLESKDEALEVKRQLEMLTNANITAIIKGLHSGF